MSRRERDETENGPEREAKVGIEVGFGGVLKGLASLLEAAEKLAERVPVDEGREIRFGPGTRAVYGFSVRSLGEGGPVFETFGNVREKAGGGAVVDEVREPMVDVLDEGDYYRVVAEMPGVEEGDVRAEAKGDVLILSAETGDRKYHKELLLSSPVEAETAERVCRNGILELRLWKADEAS